MCIAAAIIGGAVIGAAGTAIAGGEAASATQSAANTAAGVQRQALAQQATLAAPYTGLGQAALPNYEALLGIGGKGGPNAQQIQQTLSQLPGYQFTLNQGLQSTEGQLAAAGLGKSGNMVTAINQQASGIADQNYQQYLQDMLAPVQIGQGAAAGQAANIQTGASNLGNIAINQGNNLAGIYANEAAGLTRAVGNAGNQYLTYQTLQNLNNPDSIAGNPYAGGATYQAPGYDPGLMGGGGGYTYNIPGT